LKDIRRKMMSKKIIIKPGMIRGMTSKVMNSILEDTDCECLVAVTFIRSKKTGLCYPIGYSMRSNCNLEYDVNVAVNKLTTEV
jgi:hypothetical protein